MYSLVLLLVVVGIGFFVHHRTPIAAVAAIASILIDVLVLLLLGSTDEQGGPDAATRTNSAAIEVQIARSRFRPRVRQLGVDEAVAVLADYERRNRIAAPVVRAVLSRLAGFPYDGQARARRRLVAALPLLALSR